MRVRLRECGRVESIWRLKWLPVLCVRGLGSTGVLFFWTAPVAFTTRDRGLTFNNARVLIRAPIDEARLSTHRHRGTTQRREVRALMPKCSPITTACVSSPKDWAVLIGSHMQQEVVISFGAPTSGRTCPHMDCASTEMQDTKCNNFASGNHVRGARFNAYFALSRATSARQCTTETRGQ